MANKVVIDPASGCWLWQGARNQRGYGVLQRGSKQHLVHRVAYQALVGPIPTGPGRIVLDHVVARGCVYRHCCNPAHLEAVTNRENILRGDSPSARAIKVTHCPQGHEYTEENTFIERDGSRRCRKCQQHQNERRLEERRKAGIRPAPPRIPCGDDIRVRLPIDLDPVIRQMAAEEGITAALFMRRLAQEEVARRGAWPRPAVA